MAAKTRAAEIFQAMPKDKTSDREQGGAGNEKWLSLEEQLRQQQQLIAQLQKELNEKIVIQF